MAELQERANAPKPEKQKEVALRILAEKNGVVKEAWEALRDDKELGIDIGLSTLHMWKRRYKERYGEIRATVLPEIHAQAAKLHREAMTRAMDGEEKALKRMMEELHNIPPRDLPNAFRNLATSAGIHAQRARELAGEHVVAEKPTESVEALLTSLANRGVSLNLEMKAEPQQPQRPKAVPNLSEMREAQDG